MTIQQLESRVLLANFASVNAGGTLSVVGTSKADRLEVSTSATSVIAKRGNETLSFPISKVKRIWMNAFGGDDKLSNFTSLPSTLLGEAGNDTVRGGNGADRLDGGQGQDQVSYSGFGDMRAAIKLDALTGESTGWSKVGNISDQLDHVEALLGGWGSDVLRVEGGPTGSDPSSLPTFALDGGGGFNNRLYIYSPVNVDLANGHYFVGDGASVGQSRTKILAGDLNERLTLVTELSAYVAFDSNTIAEFGSRRVYRQSASANYVIISGSGDDRIYGNGLNNTIFGGDGRDTILAADGADDVTPGGGNDVVYLGLGNDRSVDTIIATGDDQIFGGAGNDTINSGDGNDLISGDDGNDSLLAGDGNDTLFGGEGFDSLYAGDHDDVLYTADGGPDLIDSGFGIDTLYGDTGPSYEGGAEVLM